MSKSEVQSVPEGAAEDSAQDDLQVQDQLGLGVGRGAMLVLALGILFSCLAIGTGMFGTVDIARERIPTVLAQLTAVAGERDRAATLARQTEEAMSAKLTEAAQPPQIRTATSAAALSKAEPPGDWRLVLSDSFDIDSNDWPIFRDSNRYTTHETQILDGNYRWEAQAHQDFVWYVYPSSPQTTDFLMSVEVSKAEGSSGASHGVVFRVNDNSFYRFAISGLQLFSVERHTSGRPTEMISRRVSTAIRENDVNLLEVASAGSSFSFFINGQKVGEFERPDDRLETGFVGLSIGLVTPGDRAVFQFDNFELWAPP